MIEVLKQMQEALKKYHYYTIDAGLPNQSMLNKGYAAYQAGKQAIAELESQEPRNVRERWNVEFDGNDLLVCFNDHEKGDKCQYERYSPQRTWVGLTDEEIKTICVENGWDSSWQSMRFAHAIEAKLKEKNT
jgi:hypothetical protein